MRPNYVLGSPAGSTGSSGRIPIISDRNFRPAVPARLIAPSDARKSAMAARNSAQPLGTDHRCNVVALSHRVGLPSVFVGGERWAQAERLGAVRTVRAVGQDRLCAMPGKFAVGEAQS